ncbi:hypothetical protein QAD02_016848 [Eretmocerus hayati]|uniref:Uncharacterized protein n=1 Tax=Eretmocerus hayati TaxID=131215 RepID=A0ACC2PDI6_9HYME|nr:hypothetical protein QAD02_016848 [Eretmocerus hayati]
MILLHPHYCVPREYVKCFHGAVLKSDLNTARSLIEAAKLIHLECKLDVCQIALYQRKFNALHLAVQSITQDKIQLWKTITFLVDAGLKVIEDHPKPYTTCAQEAFKVEDGKLLKFFVDQGSNVNFVDYEGLTLLHHVLKRRDSKSIKLVEWLIKKGTVLDHQQNTKMSYPYLNFAAMHPNCPWQMIKVLSDAGADINGTNVRNVTSLAQAAQVGNEELVRNLIDFGANINITRCWRNSALELAVRARRKNMVLFLLSKGVNLEAKDADGHGFFRDSLVYLKSGWRNQFQDILKICLSHGAVTISKRYSQLLVLLQQPEFNIVEWMDILIHAAINGNK